MGDATPVAEGPPVFFCWRFFSYDMRGTLTTFI